MSEEKWIKNTGDKLRNLESDVAPDMWDRIQAELPRRRRNYFIAPIVITAVALLAAIGIYNLGNWSTDTAATSEDQIENTATQKSDGLDQSSGQSRSSKSTTTIANNESNESLKESTISSPRQEIATKTTVEASADKIQNPKSQSVDLNANRSNQKNDQANNLIPSDSQLNRKDQKNNRSFARLIPLESDEKVNTETLDNSQQTEESNKLNNATPSASSEIITDDNVLNVNGVSATDKNNANSSGLKLNNDSRSEAFTALSILNKDQASISKKVLPLGDGSSLGHGHLVYDPCTVKGGKRKNRVHCYKFIQQNKLVFADYSIGPQYAAKILTKKNDEFGDNILAAREDHESYLVSYNVNARLGVKLPSGLTGTAGLSFDRINERFDYFNPNQQGTITTTVIIVNGADTTVSSITIDAFGERTVQHTNSMSFISIPLMAGYTWQGSKINVGVQAGVAFNVLFTKTGRIVDGEGLQTLSGPVRNETYKTNAGVSLGGGLTFEYKINRDLSFIAEPRFNFNLRSLTADGYALDQKYITTGINIGLRQILQERVTHKKVYGAN